MFAISQVHAIHTLKLAFRIMSDAKSAKVRKAPAKKPAKQVSSHTAEMSDSEPDSDITPKLKRQKTAESAFGYFLELQDKLDGLQDLEAKLEEQEAKVAAQDATLIDKQLELTRVQLELENVQRDLEQSAEKADQEVQVLQAENSLLTTELGDVRDFILRIMQAQRPQEHQEHQEPPTLHAHLHGLQDQLSRIPVLEAQVLELQGPAREALELRDQLFKIQIPQAQQRQEPPTLQAQLQGLQDQLLRIPVLEAQVLELQDQLSAAQTENNTGADIVRQIACLLATHPVLAAGSP
jgi:chromosome segregation ATPase